MELKLTYVYFKLSKFYINIITQDAARKNVLPVALNPLFLLFMKYRKVTLDIVL